MEPITLALLAVGVSVTYIIKVAIKNYNTAQQLRDIINKHTNYIDATYEPHGNDLQMAAACTESLNRNFKGEDILSCWNKMSIDERKQKVITLTKEAASIMGVEVNNIVFDESTTRYGSYSPNGTICFSEPFLACDSQGEIIRTIYHELKHGTQEKAIQAGTNNPYGYDTPTLVVWVENNLKYENGDQDFLFYYGQQIEVDARGFAQSVFQG
ncbi:uncharacterized protein BN604_03136 [Bacteroides intestinalis CAG:315]|jgi:hypothetical protein|uniref:M48 family peptidase n=1 Tax=Bacteroides intestinalis TaxID=329854 RepID=A0A412YDN6_9BACE|nr:M48 family metallopeptidase [Bacteroides intestinalis]RGV55525.1 M48 family peptidase [Bacteroides intestinalis]RHA60333.1 M48 family peptidase [Bacteroides intestinalis]CDD97044.1 uncharacterized protein BN604_03136 [Bacteroides intestinalis CAG:315]